MKRNLIVIIIILALVFCLCACTSETSSNIKSLQIKANSFNDLYDVDEELDLKAIEIIVLYKNGESLIVPCTQSMVVGFDTTTTGDKSLYVVYNNVKSTPWEYKVVNKGNETRSIVTSSRLKVQSSELPNAASYAFFIKKGDLGKISGIVFTVYCASGLGVRIDKTNIDITNLPSGWEAATERIDGNSLKLLVYKTSGRDIDSDLSLVTLNIIEEKLVPIVVKEITLSDGENDYYLPNIK